MSDSLVPSPAAGVELSSTPVQIPSQVPQAIRTELERMGRVVAPAPTEVLYTPLNECEPYAAMQVQRDVSYGPDARNLLDIFAPDNGQSKRAVLVFVHGGAFMRGDRRIGNGTFNDNIAVWAARQGYVGVNMTYRLAPAHTWPAAQHDIQTAMAWLRANAQTLGIDTQRIVLMGHSAGAAHVAQYLAFAQFHVDAGAGVAGAVLLSGIFDPSTAEVNPPLQAYFGDDASHYGARSAVPGLVASKVPLLLAYAELDPPDFCSQSQQLHAALCQTAKSQFLYQLMGHSHMSEVFAINSADKSLSSLLQTFIDKQSSSI